jgi:hypothetical protein
MVAMDIPVRPVPKALTARPVLKAPMERTAVTAQLVPPARRVLREPKANQATANRFFRRPL